MWKEGLKKIRKEEEAAAKNQQKMKMTRRQQLIGQMRTALSLLERPSYNNESIIFDVAETEFEFTTEQLDEKSMQLPIGWAHE